MCQFVVNMKNWNASSFKFQTKERIFVSIFFQTFIEAYRKKQTAQYQKVECRELCIRMSLSMQ